MPKRTVRFGSVQYVDQEGAYRVGYENEEIDFSRDEEDRLDGLGALFPKGKGKPKPIPTPEPSEPATSPPAPPTEEEAQAEAQADAEAEAAAAAKK